MNETEPIGDEEFREELSLQKRAESLLMLRGAAILAIVTVLVVIRSMVL